MWDTGKQWGWRRPHCWRRRCGCSGISLAGEQEQEGAGFVIILSNKFRWQIENSYLQNGHKGRDLPFVPIYALSSQIWFFPLKGWRWDRWPVPLVRRNSHLRDGNPHSGSLYGWQESLKRQGVFSSFSPFSNDIKVIVGENDIGDTEQMKLEVAEVVIHPMYSDSSYNNDFSILRLPSPLSFSSSISPVCLPSDATATFTGEVIWFLSISCLHRMVLYTSHNLGVQPNPIPSIHTSTQSTTVLHPWWCFLFYLVIRLIAF